MRTNRREWFRYRVIHRVAERSGVLVTLLALAVVFLVAAVTGLVAAFTPLDGAGGMFHDAYWTLLMILDPGTIANDSDPHAFWYRVFSLVGTVGGILIVSTLIG